MSLKLRIACAALLATAALPAFALQLGEIQVKSALNQPLVAAIPLHPKSLTELDGLSVGLASADDFTRAGLELTPTDKSLRFHVVTDNNGQKLILVTSTEPISDPYLDFLVQVNTREGKQLREFVALLNPVIEAPAPAVQEAPVAGSPPARAPAAELPPASAFPQPSVAPARKAQAPAVARPRAAQAQAQAQTEGHVEVRRGDTLSGIARQATRGTDINVNQMMLALQAINPDAFFKHNINNLRAGAILRMPTRDQIDQRSAALAAAEVHRQVEAWRAAKPRPATIVAGAAAEATAGAAPKREAAAPATDHLTLVPPTGPSKSAGGAPGAAGGAGAATATGAEQRLAAGRDTLISLKRSNADLESRVRDLEAISTKTGKLLSLKDATIAELQQKLARVQAAKPAAASPVAGAREPAPPASAKAAAPADAGARTAPAPWYAKPATWIALGIVVLVLLVLGLLRHRRGGGAIAAVRGPLSDPDDVVTMPDAPADAVQPDETSLREQLSEHPADPEVYLALCRLYRAQGDTASFTATAGAMRAYVADPADPAWQEVAGMGRELSPQNPLFEAAGAAPAAEDASGADGASAEMPERTDGLLAPAADPDAESVAASAAPGHQTTYVDDPVDTKLDLARAYLDLDDPVSARAMLAEVIEEGSQVQKDQAKRLLADVAG